MSRKRKPTQARVNRRVRLSAKRTILAEYGWHATPIQHVVKRWRGRVREDLLQGYFMDVAFALRERSHSFNVVERSHCSGDLTLGIQVCGSHSFNVVERSHWPAVFELGLALDKVLCDRSKPAYWLLTLPINVAVNMELEPWGELSARIVKNGGPHFDPRTLRKTAERLKIT
jgi:hypothetical protein